MSEVLEAGEMQAVRDLKAGIRIRKGWAKILVTAKKNGLTEDQVRGFVAQNGLFSSDATRKNIATSLGFDREGAADFFATIAPIIMEMMAACAV